MFHFRMQNCMLQRLSMQGKQFSSGIAPDQVSILAAR